MGLGGADLSHGFSIASPKSGLIPGMVPGVSSTGWGMLPEMTGEGREEVCVSLGCWGMAPSPAERCRPTTFQAAGGLDQPLAQEWVP